MDPDRTPRPLVGSLRREYPQHGLRETEMDPDPVRQFVTWLDAAVRAGEPEPNATVLATADDRGRPSARVVLLKGLDGRGFVFYTNERSRKGREIQSNPYAALVFHWPSLARQVRVSGAVRQIPREDTDAYFASRPEGAKLGAWASAQSAVAASRAAIDERLRSVRERFAGQSVPRPPHWVGYAVAPDEVEFWQGQPNRLHDRLRYRRSGDGWVLERLWP